MTNTNRVILCSALLLLASFYGFSRYVKNGGLKKLDFDSTVKIQERVDRSSRLRLASFVGNVMEGSTYFASPVFTSLFVGFLTIASLADIRNKKIRLRGFIIPVLFALLVLGEVYGKNVVHHPSPPFFMIKNPTSIFPKDYVNEQFSYPSGHVARAVFIGFVLSGLLSCMIPFDKGHMFRWVFTVGAILIYVGIVSVSRVYLGHHWLSDIIGGGLLGAGFGIISWTLFPVVRKPSL